MKQRADGRLNLLPDGLPPTRWARWCPRCCVWKSTCGSRRCLECGCAVVRPARYERRRAGELRPGVVAEFEDPRDERPSPSVCRTTPVTREEIETRIGKAPLSREHRLGQSHRAVQGEALERQTPGAASREREGVQSGETSREPRSLQAPASCGGGIAPSAEASGDNRATGQLPADLRTGPDALPPVQAQSSTGRSPLRPRHPAGEGRDAHREQHRRRPRTLQPDQAASGPNSLLKGRHDEVF